MRCRPAEVARESLCPSVILHRRQRVLPDARLQSSSAAAGSGHVKRVTPMFEHCPVLDSMPFCVLSVVGRL